MSHGRHSIIHREKTFNVVSSVTGLDSLECHKVEEREGQIIVTADKRELVITEDSEERIVIVGGEAAGQNAAETLRSASVSQCSYNPHLTVFMMTNVFTGRRDGRGE